MADDSTASTTMASEMSDPSKELTFPKGIPGFENCTRYLLQHSDTESGRVYWMQSCEDPEISFALVDPAIYSLNYQLELTDDEESLLQAESADQILVFLMVWKPDDPEATQKSGLHANITCPILINVEKRVGMQKLITSPKVELNISA